MPIEKKTRPACRRHRCAMLGKDLHKRMCMCALCMCACVGHSHAHAHGVGPVVALIQSHQWVCIQQANNINEQEKEEKKCNPIWYNLNLKPLLFSKIKYQIYFVK